MWRQMKLNHKIRIKLEELVQINSVSHRKNRLTLINRIATTTHMKKLGLDFDDSTAHQAMKIMIVQEIIYDRYFDAIPDVQRVMPKDIVWAISR